MVRIFSGLAVFALALMSLNLYLGWTGGDFNEVSQEYRASQEALMTVKLKPGATATDVAAAESTQHEIRIRLEALKSRSGIHILFGVLAALITVMVNSVSITYFIGTGRWVSEVSDTYGLSKEFDQRARKLKSRVFPWSILGISTVLAIAAFGAAADPGTLRETTMKWVGPHFLMAIIGSAVIAYAMFRQVLGIRNNQSIITDILTEVKRIREERGLAVPSTDTRHSAPFVESNA